MNKKTVISGAFLIVVAIILGAFGAHALKEKLDANQLSSFETGVRYQMYQGFSLLILGLNAVKFKFKLHSITGLLLVGTLLFSGSIYGLSLQPIIEVKLSFLGPITPLGGLLLIIAWVIFIVQLKRQKNG
jgi:uncharacterized membrane protein YgdD (TMEM256/DUF423 family)